MTSYKQKELKNCIITRLWNNENTKHKTLDNLTIFVKSKEDNLMYAICTNKYMSVWSCTDESEKLYKFDNASKREQIENLSENLLNHIDYYFQVESEIPLF